MEDGYIFETRDLTAGYYKLAIIQQISLRVKQGHILTIIGPNGSGKSTFLKSIYGLIKVFEGSSHFEGKEITRLPSDVVTKLGIRYVPQINNVFLKMTIEENLEMGGYATKAHDEVGREMGRVFELFPRLKERRKQKASTLSGGERQMLTIGAGIMTKPKLLLLDEPTAGLAPGLVLDVLNKICEIRDSGATIILVEQHAEKALQIADQAAVLLAGKKVLDGNADEILKREDIGQVFLGKVRPLL